MAHSREKRERRRHAEPPRDLTGFAVPGILGDMEGVEVPDDRADRHQHDGAISYTHTQSVTSTATPTVNA